MALLRPLVLGCGLGAAMVVASLPRVGEAAGGERPRRPEVGRTEAARPAAPRVAAGPTQHGKASYYHRRFNGRRMANGERFDPNAAIAAHKTLPLGTTVRVTNLENGRSAVVEVTDRGPFVRGRIIDLAPRIAERLAMKQEGVVRVAVTPLAPAQEVADAR